MKDRRKFHRTLILLWRLFPDLHKAGPWWYGGGLLFALEGSELWVLNNRARFSRQVKLPESTPGGMVYPVPTISRTAKTSLDQLMELCSHVSILSQ